MESNKWAAARGFLLPLLIGIVLVGPPLSLWLAYDVWTHPCTKGDYVSPSTLADAFRSCLPGGLILGAIIGAIAGLAVAGWRLSVHQSSISN
jgi:hypothetical protein